MTLAYTISFLQASDNLVVFHAGTSRKDKQIVTSGGRVLGVTGIGTDIVDARSQAYNGVQNISFDGMIFRNDIAAKAAGY